MPKHINGGDDGERVDHCPGAKNKDFETCKKEMKGKIDGKKRKK